MKALVLAAGRGSRMRAAAEGARLSSEQSAAADAGLKAMMPIAGRPFLDYVLSSLADAGVDLAALVLAPEQVAMVRAHYREMNLTRLRIDFLLQHEPRGTADAVLCAEEWAGTDPFLILNSDNLYPVSVLRQLRDAQGPAVPGFERDSLALPIERVGAFALIEAAAGPKGPPHSPEEPRHGCLTRIVEKPGVAAMEQAGPRALVSMNVWRADARLFDACRDVPVSSRGEKELPQAVGLAAERRVCFEVIRVSGEVLDLSSRGDIARVSERLAGVEVRL